MKPRSLTTALLLALAFATESLAQRPSGRRAQGAPAAVAAPAPEAGSELTIYLMTMGVGEQIWEKFGHNAIWIHDARSGTDSVYHWGLFNFRQPHFIARFLKGQMLYSMGGFSLAGTLDDYNYLDRTVVAQELDLTNAQKQQIRDFITWNEQPEHREYFYNYFTDNCSTRVRDIIDRAIGGQLKAASQTKMTPHSYRWHALRSVQDLVPLTMGMDVGLGRPSDQKLSVWQAMFLPRAVHDFVRDFTVTDSTGAARKLVRGERTLYTSRTHEELVDAPHWWLGYLALGMVLAAALMWLGHAAVQRKRGAVVGASVLASLFSLVVGLVGLLLLLLWTVTDHNFAHKNENLLLFNPLWLVFVVTAPMLIARGRARWTSTLAIVFVVLGVVGLAMHGVGLSRQENLRVFGLALPPIIAFAWVARQAKAAAKSADARIKSPVVHRVRRSG